MSKFSFGDTRKLHILTTKNNFSLKGGGCFLLNLKWCRLEETCGDQLSQSFAQSTASSDEITQGLFWLSLGYVHRQRQTLTPVQAFDPLIVKRIFLASNWNSPSCNFYRYSCAITVHLWEEPGPVFSASLHHRAVHSNKISPLHFLLKTSLHVPFYSTQTLLIWFIHLHLSSTATDSDTRKQVYFWTFSHFFWMNTSVLIQYVNSVKLVISVEHNFLVCGQVSLPTVPTDLKKSPP